MFEDKEKIKVHSQTFRGPIIYAGHTGTDHSSF